MDAKLQRSNNSGTMARTVCVWEINEFYYMLQFKGKLV